MADNATVRGDVTLGERSSVFFGAVLRGDRAPITIGSGTNIQDNCVVHVDYDYPVVVGQNVTVGHGAILHGCTVGDNTLIGMGAIVLNGAQVGSNCLIGAGALVPQHAVIPRRLAGLRLPRQGALRAGRGSHCRAAPGGAGLPAGGHGVQGRTGEIKKRTAIGRSSQLVKKVRSAFLTAEQNCKIKTVFYFCNFGRCGG